MHQGVESKLVVMSALLNQIELLRRGVHTDDVCRALDYSQMLRQTFCTDLG